MKQRFAKEKLGQNTETKNQKEKSEHLFGRKWNELEKQMEFERESQLDREQKQSESESTKAFWWQHQESTAKSISGRLFSQWKNLRERERGSKVCGKKDQIEMYQERVGKSF